MKLLLKRQELKPEGQLLERTPPTEVKQSRTIYVIFSSRYPDVYKSTKNVIQIRQKLL